MDGRKSKRGGSPEAAAREKLPPQVKKVAESGADGRKSKRGGSPEAAAREKLPPQVEKATCHRI